MKINRPVFFVAGMILVILQGLSIVGNSKIQNNVWDLPGYMSGSLGMIGYDLTLTFGYLLFGIIGVLLILFSFRPKKMRKGLNDLPDSTVLTTPPAAEAARAPEAAVGYGAIYREAKPVEAGREPAEAAREKSENCIELLLQLQAEDEEKRAAE